MPEGWVDIFLGVSGRLILEGISILIGELCREDWPTRVGGGTQSLGA